MDLVEYTTKPATAEQVTAVAAVMGANLWTWPDSAARLAQTVTTAQVGARGRQADIDGRYELLSVSPTRWGRLPDADVSCFNSLTAMGPNSVSFALIGAPSPGPIKNGSVVGLETKAINNTTRGSARHRLGLTTAAVAGNYEYVRLFTGQSLPAGIAQGIRMRISLIPGSISPNMRWYAGIGTGLSNVALSTYLHCALFGKDPADTNMQFVYNDGAGAAQKIDLGASMPGMPVVNNLYELEVYIPPGAARIGYRVANLDAGTEVSGSVTTTDVPSAPTVIYYGCDNGTDATAVGMDAYTVGWGNIV